jgi:hypothetical protein
MATGTEMLLNAGLTTVLKLLGLDTPEKKAQLGQLVEQAQAFPARIEAYDQRQAAMLDEIRSQGELIRSLMVERSADRLQSAAVQNVLDRNAIRPIVKTAINSEVYEGYLAEHGIGFSQAALDMLDGTAEIGFGKPPLEAASAIVTGMNDGAG